MEIGVCSHVPINGVLIYAVLLSFRILLPNSAAYFQICFCLPPSFFLSCLRRVEGTDVFGPHRPDVLRFDFVPAIRNIFFLFCPSSRSPVFFIFLFVPFSVFVFYCRRSQLPILQSFFSPSSGLFFSASGSRPFRSPPVKVTGSTFSLHSSHPYGSGRGLFAVFFREPKHSRTCK